MVIEGPGDNEVEWITLNSKRTGRGRNLRQITKELSQVKEIDNGEILVKLVINIPLKKATQSIMLFHHAFTTGFPTLKTFRPFHRQQFTIKDADIPNPPVIVVNVIINY